jgi:hypothetical protein
MLQMRFMHRCIPYCKPDEGEHTELVYSDESATDETIRQMLGERRGANVISAAEEPDAPPQNDTSGSRPVGQGVARDVAMCSARIV